MDETAPYAYFEDINWGLLRLWNRRRGLDVLDVGCGFATTSQRIHDLGNRVCGIESNRDAAHVAQQRLDRLIETDLQNAEALGDARFDVIIFADVLEHLPWPVAVLQRYVAFLKPNGTVIVSVPNVGLWSVRLGLLFGRFHYADTGVLDRTHLRFFTRSTAVEMLRSAGLEPFRRTYNPGLVRPFVPIAKWFAVHRSPFAARDCTANGERQTPHPAAILDSAPYRTYLKMIYPLERVIARVWPGLLAFQMIFEARPV